jgi:TPP-dependent pyruvate/acetoin dehydrogenase alpha subunit
VREWKAKDPVKRVRGSLEDAGVPASRLDDMMREERTVLAKAVEFAEASAFPVAGDALSDLFVSPANG